MKSLKKSSGSNLIDKLLAEVKKSYSIKDIMPRGFDAKKPEKSQMSTSEFKSKIKGFKTYRNLDSES